jgi:Transposase DDE domain
MKSKDGFVQAYNAQIAVDSAAQIIVAQDATQSTVDSGQLVPMIDAAKTNLGRYPARASADAGYCSQGNLEALETRSIDGYVATGRARDAVDGHVKGETAAASGAPQLGSASTPEAEPKEAKPSDRSSTFIFGRAAALPEQHRFAPRPYRPHRNMETHREFVTCREPRHPRALCWWRASGSHP